MQIADVVSIAMFISWPFWFQIVVKTELATIPFVSDFARTLFHAASEILEKMWACFAVTFLLLVSVSIPILCSMRLGWFDIVKQYTDEAADICNIFFFICTVTLGPTVQLCFDAFFSDAKLASRSNGSVLLYPEPNINSSATLRKLSLTAWGSAVCVLAALLATSAVFFAGKSASDFFKNDLDQVADACSILKMALFIYYSSRVETFKSQLSKVPNSVYASDSVYASGPRVTDKRL